MARHIFQSVFKDGQGRIIPSATISVYLAGTGTTSAANVYVAETGGSPVTSVTTASDGSFSFWVDDGSYSLNQRFKITMTKTDFAEKSYNNITIFAPVPTGVYYPDANATDQGAATTGGYSLKDIIDAAGSNNITIKFRNSSGSATTSYTLTTSEVIPATCAIEIEIGARITQGGTATLTINGPVVGNPMHQWLSGFAAGEVTFALGTIKHFLPIWVNDDLALTVSFAPTGGCVDLLSKAYTHSGNWTINKSLHIFGHGATITFSATTDVVTGIKITASDVSLYAPKVVGGAYSAAHYNRKAIQAIGTSNASRIENIIIYEAEVDTWPVGIWLEYVNHFWVSRNKVENIYDHGISVLACADGWVDNNYIDNIPADSVITTNAYGIIITEGNVADTACQRIQVKNNTVKRVPTWDGINMHGGDDIEIIGNIIRDCRRGVNIGIFDDASDYKAPKRPKVENNNIFVSHGADEIITLANTVAGVLVAGATTATANRISMPSIQNNTIRGYTRGIAGGYFDDAIISNNNCSDYLHGIDLSNSCANLDISNNRLNSGSQVSTCSGIRFETAGDVWTGVCQNNTIIGDDYGIAVLETGIDVDVHFLNNKIDITSQFYHIDGLSNFTGRIVVTGGYTSAASATELYLGQSDDVITITGTTAITSIAATSTIAGRTVKLIFANVLTFTDGNNLKLAGNFVTTADDTITLTCDGANWHEVCRSIN